MRLINSTTHRLKNFSDEIPEYAILSHTWEEELTFQAMQEPNVKDIAGYAKVEGCCAQAKRDGFNYVWIDTCCIDKTSSAELSEAINTMYQWYKKAQVCYAYLPDVPSGQDPQYPDSFFAKSRWYKRGWTLQELIAPSSLVFYGKGWHEIGTKLSLQESVSKITGIPVSVLKFGDVESFSVAQRMSWASKRQTTRVEDMAYCFMGLFGIHMPMLYGEGERAFGRLQEEIVRTSDDHTLFAWTEQGDEHRWITRGVLADSPAEFIKSNDIIQSKPILESTPYSMTNKGLRIELPLFKINDRIHFAILNFKRLSSEGDDLLGILLERLLTDKGEYFARIVADEIKAIPKEKLGESKQRIAYIIPKNVEDSSLREIKILRPFRISLVITQPEAGYGYSVSEVYSSSSEWKKLGDECYRLLGRRTGVLGVLMIKYRNAEDFVVILGRCEGLAWCDIVTSVGNTSLVRIYDSYRHASYAGCRDRITKSLQGGRSVAVAIRKKAKQKRASEGEYDGEYAVHISAHAGQDNKGSLAGFS